MAPRHADRLAAGPTAHSEAQLAAVVAVAAAAHGKGYPAERNHPERRHHVRVLAVAETRQATKWRWAPLDPTTGVPRPGC